jgi:hypothetical protein
MQTVRLTCSLPEPDGPDTELTVRGRNEIEAFASLANLLHLTVFECDVRNNIFVGYVDYVDEQGFLDDCRNYVCADPNAQTSDLIWSSLRTAVENVVVTQLD